MSQQKEETEPELRITSAEGATTEPELGITAAETATTEPEQNTTKPKAKGGRPRKAPDTGLWAIRGVDLETRAIVEKTAQRAGKTIGQFVNEDMRSFCQGQLTQSQLPASPRDLQVQVEQLTQLVEGIAARMAEPARKGFWQRVFGK
jgi:predicted hydrocarbon binding protein